MKDLREYQASEKVIENKPQDRIENEQVQSMLRNVKAKDSDILLIGEDMQKIDYKLANCCNPIPGDDVFGFVTVGDGIKIHRTNCPNAARLLSHYGHRVVKTKWAKNKEISFLTGIRIVGLDDVGVINKITNLISGEMRVNISALTIEAEEGIFRGNIRLYVHDKEELDELVRRLKALNGIQSVDRYDAEST
jgi:GTP pyrophosphokinase